MYAAPPKTATSAAVCARAGAADVPSVAATTATATIMVRMLGAIDVLVSRARRPGTQEYACASELTRTSCGPGLPSANVATPHLPAYDELPVRPGAPAGSSWGLWGERDVLGCLNLIDQAAVRRGLESAASGWVHPLNLELEIPDPPLFGRPRHRHEVHEGGWSSDDSLTGWN